MSCRDMYNFQIRLQSFMNNIDIWRADFTSYMDKVPGSDECILRARKAIEEGMEKLRKHRLEN